MRRPELDGLRGVAVLLVVLSHTSNRGLLLAPGLDFRGLGRTGVFLFFVLSSYLLTDQLLGRGAAELRRPRTWLVYAGRRLARVYPGLVLTLGVTLALGGMTLPHALEHLALVRAEGHLWTIPVEMLFYLALPPLVLALSALGLARVQASALAAAIVAASLAWPPDFPAREPDFRPSVWPFLPVFLTGSLAAVIHRSGWLPQRLGAQRALATLGLVGVAAHSPALMSLFAGKPLPHDEFHLLFGSQSLAAAALLLGVVASHGAAARWLTARPLVFVGRASYSVYLLHTLPLAYVEAHGPRGGLGALGVLLSSVALGAASYALVERPFLRDPR